MCNFKNSYFPNQRLWNLVRVEVKYFEAAGIIVVVPVYLFIFVASIAVILGRHVLHFFKSIFEKIINLYLIVAL